MEGERERESMLMSGAQTEKKEQEIEGIYLGRRSVNKDGTEENKGWETSRTMWNNTRMCKGHRYYAKGRGEVSKSFICNIFRRLMDS